MATTLANGLGEEVFFRGALDRAIGNVLAFTGKEALPSSWRPRWQTAWVRKSSSAAPSTRPSTDRAVVVSTAAYPLAAASTRNPALVLAAALLGTLFSR